MIDFNNLEVGKVIGSKVVFRNANKDDAEFIVKLRTDPDKGKYLSYTSSDVTLQVSWLEKYANDNTQIYFIIEDKKGERFGTVRLYDHKEDSFCWGSWILRDGRPSGFAMESALMVYHFALGLGFKRSHFDVRKDNQRAWQFHERFGAVRVAETDDDYIYTISLESIYKAFEKYIHYLPNGIEVIRKAGVELCRIIDLPKISDQRGNLTFIEGGQQIPFGIRRVYYLYDVPGGSVRGGHAHKELHQLIIAMSGSFDVVLDDGTNKKRVHLNRSYNGLYVCPMIWRELDNFSSGSVCMVLASNCYDEADYYRDYGGFMKAVKK